MSDNGKVIFSKSSNNRKIPDHSFNGGINVCVWFLFSSFIFHLGIESYAKYGTVRNPVQLTLDFIEYNINNYWWLYCAVVLCVCAQILLYFTIRNFLIWRAISGSIGMVLHVFNSCLTFNFITPLINICKYIPGLAKSRKQKININKSNRKIEYNTTKYKTKASKRSFAEGINVLVWFLFFCCLIHVIIENFTKYGVIITPSQLTLDFIKYMQTYWWLYFATFINFWLQVLLCYTIEKLLIWKAVSEELGIGLHIFNSLFLFNVTAVLSYAYQCSPFAVFNIILHVFMQPFKYWSYIYVNSKHRLGFHHHNKGDDQGETNQSTKTITYPQNVTLMNLAEFVTTSQIFTYSLNGVKRKPRDLRTAFKLICYSTIVHYLCAFLLHQFIIPDTELASQFFLRRDILNFIVITIKLVIPIFPVWFMYFYFYLFKCWFPICAAIWGTEDSNTSSDWWNAETTTVYWSKWNIQVHTVLKDCIYVPVLRMGYSKLQASLAVFLVSGILHDYLFSLPCRTAYGSSICGMLIQLPFAVISTYLHKNFSTKLGNLVFWINIIVGNVGCFISVYYKYNYKNSLTIFQI